MILINLSKDTISKLLDCTNKNYLYRLTRPTQDFSKSSRLFFNVKSGLWTFVDSCE